MTIPTEPIGSIPRPLPLIEAVAARDGYDPTLEPLYEAAIRDTIKQFEATGSPVITDGEQRKYHNFWTYCVHGLPNTAPDGFQIPFSAGHVRRMPRLTAGPFRYLRRADSYLDVAMKYAHKPVKQAVISPSALSLMYPAEQIPGYSREQFIDDLLHEHETEIRNCLRKGAHKVQIDFTEGRFAVKIDPTGKLLHSFIDLNNMALARFSPEERAKIGVHTCPGSDRDSTHSGDVDYSELLPSLFQLKAGNFYVALAGEKDRKRVLKIIRDYRKPDQRVFVGVVSPIDPRVETPEEIRDRVLEAAEHISVEYLGTCDDCGFSPFCDDTTTTRETAFAKIRSRVAGTELAARALGGVEVDQPRDEEALLREVALQNANTIFAARQREEELRARLAAVVESSEDAIISKTLEGIITTWNKAAERIFGYTSEEVVGKSITILIPPDRINEEPAILDRLKKGERVEHFETIRMRKDGALLDISLTISPIRESSGKLVGASKIARDITERKQMEANNAQLYDRITQAAIEREQLLEAERAARAEAERVSMLKDEFLATLSHELRTPLNAILGWSQILRARKHADEEVAEGLEVIERNTRVQTQLIDDLLDVSRIISGKVRLDVQQVDIQDVVKAAIASIRHSADAKGIRLIVVVDPLASPVRGDPGRLQQCFWNLLSNAIKFTPRDGRVQVSLERVNSHLEVTVTDNGQGIKPDFLPHIFERFRQADASTTRRHGGLGLGLSIVKNLIELHGGKVRAKSTGEGQGSTFSVELPVMALRPPADGDRREHPSSVRYDAIRIDHPSLDGITVLVVDDEVDARSLLKRVLESCGAKVIPAATAAEALTVVRTNRPDMIISDIGMPGEDGYEFIRKVRALPLNEGGRTPAAALTAFARAEDRTRALRSGYQSHVAKPVEPTELTAVVASLAMKR